MKNSAHRTSSALSTARRARRPVLITSILVLLAGCGGGERPSPQPAPAPLHGTPVQETRPTATLARPSLIDVLSEPTGASIFLNGRLVGATPLKLPALEPGAYSLRLERHGRAPRSLALQVGREAQVIRVELPPQPTGSLDVAVEPRGAEVLLNGEWVGVTPLQLDHVPVGIHEIMIRKTNYRPFTSIVHIEAGRTAHFADKDKDHRLLKDLIFEMLEGLIRSEPNRASHLLDKGHYLFINHRMDEAAEAFLQAEEVSVQPPIFPDGMTEGEREAELRLYREDRKRVGREVARHRGIRSSHFATTRPFNAAYEKAQQRRLAEKADSWEWVENRGRALLAEDQYLQAAQLYQTHLERVRGGATAFPCMVGLMKVHLQLRDLSGFRADFENLMPLCADDPRKLLEVVRTAQPYHDRLRAAQRSEFLSIMEAPLQRLIEHAEVPTKGEFAAELARLLILQHRHADAIPFIELAIHCAESEQDKEERSLQLAETLRLAKCLDEAKALFTRLTASPRETIRKRAKAGLVLLGVSKP
jgi:tetratricopeptide (TPR) repeat protein